MRPSRTLHREVGGVPLTLVIVPYATALIISLGTKALSGTFIEVQVNQVTSTCLHTPLLGDRANLVAPVFAEKLAAELKPPRDVTRLLLALSVPNDVMMNRAHAEELVKWVDTELGSCEPAATLDQAH